MFQQSFRCILACQNPLRYSARNLKVFAISENQQHPKQDTRFLFLTHVKIPTRKVMSRPIHLITATDLVNFGAKLLAELGKSEVAKLLDREPGSCDDILQISGQIDLVRLVISARIWLNNFHPNQQRNTLLLAQLRHLLFQTSEASCLNEGCKRWNLAPGFL